MLRKFANHCPSTFVDGHGLDLQPHGMDEVDGRPSCWREDGKGDDRRRNQTVGVLHHASPHQHAPDARAPLQKCVGKMLRDLDTAKRNHSDLGTRIKLLKDRKQHTLRQLDEISVKLRELDEELYHVELEQERFESLILKIEKAQTQLLDMCEAATNAVSAENIA